MAIDVLEVAEEMSNRKRKDLDGYSAKKHDHVLNKFPAILIGQLAKNDYADKEFTGQILMESCLSKIYEGQKILGGRIIILECQKIKKLLDFYSDFGFKQIQTTNSSDSQLLMLNKILDETEIIT